MTNNEPKGKIIVRLPDNHHNDLIYHPSDITIKSDNLTSNEIASQLIKKSFEESIKLKTLNKESDVMSSRCCGNYCEFPFVGFYTENAYILPLNTFNKFKEKTIILKPRTQHCHNNSDMNKYCLFTDKKIGCIGCKNPFMQIAIKVANNMKTNCK